MAAGGFGNAGCGRGRGRGRVEKRIIMRKEKDETSIYYRTRSICPY